MEGKIVSLMPYKGGRAVYQARLFFTRKISFTSFLPTSFFFFLFLFFISFRFQFFSFLISLLSNNLESTLSIFFLTYLHSQNE